MKISNIYGILFILHLVLTISIQPANAQSCTKAPASFEDNRIYLEVKAGNETLKFYTDSGGGLFPFVYADTAKKLDMNIKKTENKNGIKVGYSTLPKTLKQQNIPLSNEWENKVRIFESGEEIKTEASEIRFMIGDGFFGASLFAGRIWHFNYGTKQLLYCSQLQDTTRFSVISLFFKESIFQKFYL